MNKIYGIPVTTPIKPGASGGANGKSAYEIAVEYGFEGTEEEWLESLKGKNGDSIKGDPGASIHYCTYNDELKASGNWADISLFPNGLPQADDLFITASGYVGRVTHVTETTSNQGTPGYIIGYRLVANLNGENGYTPIKGEDYYTEADKTEMVQAVIAQLPVYDGEVVAE